MSGDKILEQLDDLGRLVRSNSSIVGADVSRALANAHRAITKAAAKAEGAHPWEFETIRIAQSRGPTLRFEGTTIASYKTHADRDGRWYECRLWLTPDGAYIAEKAYCSDREGERDFIEAADLPTSMPEDERRIAVMDHFQWSTPARNMAKSLGWKLERWID